MKKGFTLAEVLITLGIVGIVSAIMIPAIMNSKPDPMKATYLKVYDSLQSNLKELASDSSLYQYCGTVGGIGDVDCHGFPFINQSLPIGRSANEIGALTNEVKFCNLLSEKLGGTNTNCSGTVYSYVANGFTDYFNNHISFTTSNGIQWMVSPAIATSYDGANRTATWQRDIYADINGTTGENCIYNANNCKNPDRFRFIVYADGTLIPGDGMGQEYINSRRSFLKRKNAIIDANLIANADPLTKQTQNNIGTCGAGQQALPQQAKTITFTIVPDYSNFSIKYTITTDNSSADDTYNVMLYSGSATNPINISNCGKTQACSGTFAGALKKNPTKIRITRIGGNATETNEMEISSLIKSTGSGQVKAGDDTYDINWTYNNENGAVECFNQNGYSDDYACYSNCKYHIHHMQKSLAMVDCDRPESEEDAIFDAHGQVSPTYGTTVTNAYNEWRSSDPAYYTGIYARGPLYCNGEITAQFTNGSFKYYCEGEEIQRHDWDYYRNLESEDD